MLSNIIFTNNPLVLQLVILQLIVLAAIVLGIFIKKKYMWVIAYLLIGVGGIWCVIHVIDPPELFDTVVSIIGFGIFALDLVIQFIAHGICASAKRKTHP